GRRCALRAGWRTPARSWGPPARRRSHRRRGPWPRARAARTATARRARRRARRRRLQAATQTRIPTTVDGRLRTEDATPMSVLYLASSVVRLGHQTIEQVRVDIAAGEDCDRDLALHVDLAREECRERGRAARLHHQLELTEGKGDRRGDLLVAHGDAGADQRALDGERHFTGRLRHQDRKSTRLNSSH